MELLYWLEDLRNPVLDAFFSIVTILGEETLFIIAGLLLFWCVDKLEGYYLLAVGLTGTVINRFLKLVFRVPRPWVRDEDFTIVESARAKATGYSFPSGHTQSAVGIFAAVARWNRQKLVRAVCIVLCVLVPLSRMYLGVHTPADVGVSILVALALVFGIYPVIRKAAEHPNTMRILFGGMILLAVANLAFLRLYLFPADVDAELLAHNTKNMCTTLGCMLGVFLTYEIERRYIRFDTKAVWWAQLIKLAVGFALLLAIKSGLKAPLSALFGGSYLADGLRYFLMTAFAGCVWPLTFRFFGRLGAKPPEL